jgi:hypothetical protein
MFSFFSRKESPKIIKTELTAKSFEVAEKSAEKTEEELNTEKIKSAKNFKELCTIIREIEPLVATATITSIIHYKKGQAKLGSVTDGFGIREKMVELMFGEKVTEAKSFEDLYKVIADKKTITTGHGYITAVKLIEQIKLAELGDFYVNDITAMSHIRHKVITLINQKSKQ